jgi:hypothetical protein
VNGHVSDITDCPPTLTSVEQTHQSLVQPTQRRRILLKAASHDPPTVTSRHDVIVTSAASLWTVEQSQETQIVATTRRRILVNAISLPVATPTVTSLQPDVTAQPAANRRQAFWRTRRCRAKMADDSAADVRPEINNNRQRNESGAGSPGTTNYEVTATCDLTDIVNSPVASQHDTGDGAVNKTRPSETEDTSSTAAGCTARSTPPLSTCTTCPPPPLLADVTSPLDTAAQLSDPTVTTVSSATTDRLNTSPAAHCDVTALPANHSQRTQSCDSVTANHCHLTATNENKSFDDQMSPAATIANEHEPCLNMTSPAARVYHVML